MVTPVEVRTQSGFRIWIKFSDGVEGTVDLSHLAGRGVFKIWEDRSFFEKAYLTDEGAVAWSDEVELCPDSLYLRITNKPPEEVLPGIGALPSNA